MALTTYCELSEVRAALGVNDVELPDTVLSLPVYEIGLVRELNRVSVSLPVAFSTAINAAEESRTSAQRALVDATHMFSVYAVARQVGVSLGSMAPKDVGDGKATLSRFSDSPYKDVLDRVDMVYTAARATLVEALVAVTGTGSQTKSTVPMRVFGAVKRGTDPVTGA